MTPRESRAMERVSSGDGLEAMNSQRTDAPATRTRMRVIRLRMFLMVVALVCVTVEVALALLSFFRPSLICTPSQTMVSTPTLALIVLLAQWDMSERLTAVEDVTTGGDWGARG